MKPHAVVLDLFRTLADLEGVDPNAFRKTDRIASSLGIPPEPFGEWRQGAREVWVRRRSPGLVDLIAAYCERAGTPRSRDRIQLALGRANAPYDEALLHPHPHVARTLRRVRDLDIKIGILSNTDDQETRLWATSPLALLVDAVAFSVDTGFAKPEPDSYRSILSALGGVAPSRAIYVGDGESHELRGAKSAGFSLAVCTTEFVAPYDFQSPERRIEISREADATIGNLEELLGYLR